ncbi:MAG: DNA repair protein RadC [Gammaproteobacteria bacterium]|nr:DNA repair protein RadC [Gammaproteobacteria bacterium]
MTIKDWPVQERPREKLLSKGATHLTDADLLAIFLRTGIKGFSAIDLVRSLLNRFGGLRGVLEADADEFCQLQGLGPSKYAQLQAVQELAQRHLMESLQREDALTSVELSRLYVKSKLRSYHREVFLCLFLDSQHRVIAQEELFQGSIDSAAVYPREVLNRAFYHKAAAIIFAHNHPSGIAEPSEADIAITRRLKSALDLVDIKTLDHLVVGDGIVTSMAERGLL